MKKRYFKKSDLLADIAKNKPELIFLTGKTSSGKTYLSGKLVKRGYGLVKLDRIIFESVMEKFNLQDSNTAFATYRGNAPQAWKNAFIRGARAAIIAELSEGPVVVEGALANNEMILSIFKKPLLNFLFIFLRPVDTRVYAKRIGQRFKMEIASGKTGLPKEFFQIVDQIEINRYRITKRLNKSIKEKIARFARWSWEESERRLAYFKKEFKAITILEV